MGGEEESSAEGSAFKEQSEERLQNGKRLFVVEHMKGIEHYKGRRIMQFGPFRCGTTLVWQVMKMAFPESNVVKSHKYHKETGCLVVTYRDFRDAFLSYLRVREEDAGSMGEEELRAAFIKYEGPLQTLVRYKNEGRPALFLKYELFWNDYGYIFDSLERYFDVRIEDKEGITAGTSVEENRKVADSMRWFKVYDKETKIHGGHISHPEPGAWKNLDGSVKTVLNSMMKGYLEEFGYKVE